MPALAGDPELDRPFRLMLTTTGIGETSALQILGELAVLPDGLSTTGHPVLQVGMDVAAGKSNSVETYPRNPKQ